jgi:hypothetical protein
MAVRPGSTASPRPVPLLELAVHNFQMTENCPFFIPSRGVGPLERKAPLPLRQRRSAKKKVQEGLKVKEMAGIRGRWIVI